MIYIDLPDNPGVTIFCDDSFMIRSTTEFDGGPIPQGYDHAYYSQCFFAYMNYIKLIFLVMITDPGSTQQRKVWTSLDFTKCDDDVDKIGYSIKSLGYVILCPRYLPPFKKAIVGNNKDKDYSLSTTNINDVTSVMSVTIFHELLHLFYE